MEPEKKDISNKVKRKVYEYDYRSASIVTGIFMAAIIIIYQTSTFIKNGIVPFPFFSGVALIDVLIFYFVLHFTRTEKVEETVKKIITEEEYEAKKKLEIEELNNRLLSLGLSSEILDTLTEQRKFKINRFIDRMLVNDLIVIYGNDLKLIEAERWQRIVDQGESDEFQIIYRKQTN